MRSKKHIATFLVYLALSLVVLWPIQTAAFTATISGEDGVSHFRKGEDITFVNVSAQAPVSLRLQGEQYAMECKENNSLFSCQHTFDSAVLSGGNYSLDFIENTTPQNTYSQWFIVDDQAPTIESFQVIPKNKSVLLNYSLLDTAYAGNPTVCSGLHLVSLSTEEGLIFNKSLVENSCFSSGTTEIPLSGIEGEVYFYVSVYDMLGQMKFTQTGPFTVDYKAPEITDSFLVRMGNETISVVSAQPQYAPHVQLQITLSESNLSSVVGDLSSLVRDPLLKDQYKELTPACSQDDILTTCLFNDVRFNPGQTNVTIGITATDMSGNVAKKNITELFTLINKKGEVVYFNPLANHCDNLGCYIKRGLNVFKISVQGADAGIVPSQITLGTSSVNIAQPKTKVSRCVTNNTEYTDCFANIVVTSKEEDVTKSIVLTNPSTDRLGTPLTGLGQTSVILDSYAPINVTPFTFSTSCAVAGKSATINVTVQENISSTVRIEAFPQNITGSNYSQATCKNVGSKLFSCILPMTDFVSYPEKENVSIHVTDLAGNILATHVPISVCRSENTIEPELISQIKGHTSQKIDRRLASFAPVNIYISLDFLLNAAAASEVRIIDLDSDGCIGTHYLSGEPYFINKQSFLENQGNGIHRKEPLLVVPLSGQDMRDTVPINCTINVYEIKGGVRYIKPEKQFLEIAPLQTFNQPLGTVDESVVTQLDDIKKEIKTLDEKIAKFESVDKTLSLICNIAGALGKVSQAAALIKAILYPVTLAANIIGQGETSWQGVCHVTESINNLVTSSIWPPGKISVGTGMIIKLGCLTHNCGLCTVSGLTSTATIVASGIHAFSQPSFSGSKAQAIHDANKKQAAQNILDNKNNIAAQKQSILSNQQQIQELGNADPKTTLDLTLDILDSKNTIVDLEAKNSKDLYNLQTLKEQQKEVYGNIQDEFTDDLENSKSVGSEWIVDPYSSVHFSQLCLCLPGMIYNYNKLKQLQCKEYTCIKSNAEQGLPTANCEAAFDQGYCLYYDSALYRRSGKWGSYFKGLGRSILDQAPQLAHMALCHEEYFPGGGNLLCTEGGLVMAWRPIVCGLTGAYLTLKEWKSITSNPLRNRPTDPGGEDYCANIDLGD